MGPTTVYLASKLPGFKLVGELHRTEPLVFPRCFIEDMEKKVISYPLHIFCDAFVKACADETYLRLETLYWASTGSGGRSREYLHLENSRSLLRTQLTDNLDQALK